MREIQSRGDFYLPLMCLKWFIFVSMEMIQRKNSWCGIEWEGLLAWCSWVYGTVASHTPVEGFIWEPCECVLISGGKAGPERVHPYGHMDVVRISGSCLLTVSFLSEKHSHQLGVRMGERRENNSPLAESECSNVEGRKVTGWRRCGMLAGKQQVPSEVPSDKFKVRPV